MATYEYFSYSPQGCYYSSQRGVAMVLAMGCALLLSPLYVDRPRSESSRRYYETRWSSGGLVLPAVLAGLIVAIKTASTAHGGRGGTSPRFPVYTSSADVDGDCSSSSSSPAFGIGRSTWGLAGILVSLLFALSFQSSLRQFFWS
ncbi:unnamed protein product [Cuscuta europaea]|uniref:Uncharacterized protein n=1 Tax=Cuscuta europaea TaxID=41803 RepID=A0A9P1EMS5_CUSEU|nr:unnamed protein product [Cuscuta europaea]